MSKKKKQIKEAAKSSIKVLKNGKIKLVKGVKFNITPSVDYTIDNSVISRLNGIIEETKSKPSEHKNIDTLITMVSQVESINLNNRLTNGKVVPTIVVVTSKKDATDFDFIGTGTIGDLLRASTLAPVYREIKDKWVDLNHSDKTDFTNVMFLPNLLMITDWNTVNTLIEPYKFNLLLVAVPSTKYMKANDNDESSTFDHNLSRIIMDVMDAAIAVGAKHLIIDPFDHKCERKNPTVNAKIWHSIVDTIKVKNSIDFINFCVVYDDFYIPFTVEFMIENADSFSKYSLDSIKKDETEYKEIESDDDDDDDDIPVSKKNKYKK